MTRRCRDSLYEMALSLSYIFQESSYETKYLLVKVDSLLGVSSISDMTGVSADTQTQVACQSCRNVVGKGRLCIDGITRESFSAGLPRCLTVSGAAPEGGALCYLQICQNFLLFDGAKTTS